MLRALLAAVSRFFSRRRARRLLAQQLPRGVSEARLALPAPAREPPPGEYWTLPLVGHRPSRLLRLSALPPPPAHLGVVQPRKLRLDDNLRLPPEIDPPAVPTAPERPLPVRPRTPPTVGSFRRPAIRAIAGSRRNSAAAISSCRGWRGIASASSGPCTPSGS